MTTQLQILLETIQKLRSEEGCPWDRKQTHESLIPYLHEESAEVVEAILERDPVNLKEELGDLLLQILLHSQIAAEQKQFDFLDVASTLNDKMIRRHPHVFSNKVYRNEEEQKADWEKIKAEEKALNPSKTAEGVLTQIPLTLSGLKLAYKLQKKAASIGFDWPDSSGIYAKIDEEYEELQAEIVADNQEKIEAEFGDLLFALVNLARHLDIDPERAIARTNTKFKTRFNYIETHLEKPLQEATLAEMDQLWEAAKAFDKL